MKTKNDIATKHLSKSISYNEYSKLIENLLAENKTTGNNHSENMIHYTELNKTRMDRWDKKYSPSEDTIKKVNTISKKQHWVVLTEGWCGDASHSLPIISKIANGQENIDVHVLLRDENLDLMDQYLTNGSRSIPKVIAFDEEMNELWNWGPRPKPAQDLFTQQKEDGLEKSEINLSLQKWYNKDKGKAIEEELLQHITTRKEP